ncbi:MAG: OprO/OprP family phosphate-selective porin [Methylobacillus sp.]|jgi:phosphate-selective porin OprO/OprP|nr:OprO/OprP family phosphate-selective porin [Methylobacillus sp.]
MLFKKTLLSSLLISSGLIAIPALADDSQELEELRARIQELDQKIRVLDRKNEIAVEEAAAKEKEKPVLVAGEKGFGFKSADGNFEFRLRGLIHVDYRSFGDDEVNGVKQIDGFLARRIRPTFEGTLFGKYDFRFTPEFGEGVNRAQDSGNTARVVDAYIDARLEPWFKVRAGKFKPFVGLERLQSGSDIKFIERSYVSNNILPNRDLGVSLHGDVLDGKLNYAVGVFNGSVDGGENTTTQDSNIDKDYAARVFVQPFKGGDSALAGLGAGLSFTYGDAEGTAAVTNLPSYKTPGQSNNFFSYAGTVVSDGKRLRWSPQAYYYNGPFGVLAEYAEVSQEVRRTDIDRHDTLKNNAWHVTANWILTGEDASFKGVSPKSPFTTDGKGWGAWELIARYQENNIDKDAFSTAAAGPGVRFADPRTNAESAKSWAVGVNWYLNQWVRLAVNYEETHFDKGGSVNNAGAATGGFTDVRDRDDERLLFSRLQVSF